MATDQRSTGSEEEKKADGSPFLVEKEGTPVEVAPGLTVSSVEEIKQLAARPIDSKEENALLRRLDFFIAPVIGLLYFIAFLDRGNIGNAATDGLIKDIGAPSNGLNVATSLFYVTYVLLETPFATFLRKLRPRRVLPGAIIAWGLVTTFSAFMQSYGALITQRLLLGALEACLFPSLTIYLTMFYKRTEIAVRVAYLFVASAISSAFGSLLAAALLKMAGVGGKPGWFWLYCIEGLITLVVGVAAYFLLADDFSTAYYLKDHHKELMKIRAAQSWLYQQDGTSRSAEIKKAFCDPKVYLSGLGQIGCDTALYGFSTFAVVIVKALGYSTIESQLLTAPIFAWAAIVYLTIAWLSDRTQRRGIFLVIFSSITIIGYILILACNRASVGVRLFCCYVIVTGIYVCVGLNLAWMNANVGGLQKRSTAFGIQQSMGNTSGVLAGQIYLSSESPYYWVGHGVTLGMMLMGFAVYTAQYFNWRRLNRKKEAMSIDERAEQDRAGITGDAHYSFVYQL